MHIFIRISYVIWFHINCISIFSTLNRTGFCYLLLYTLHSYTVSRRFRHVNMIYFLLYARFFSIIIYCRYTSSNLILEKYTYTHQWLLYILYIFECCLFSIFDKKKTYFRYNQFFFGQEYFDTAFPRWTYSMNDVVLIFFFYSSNNLISIFMFVFF